MRYDVARTYTAKGDDENPVRSRHGTAGTAVRLTWFGTFALSCDGTKPEQNSSWNAMLSRWLAWVAQADARESEDYLELWRKTRQK